MASSFYQRYSSLIGRSTSSGTWWSYEEYESYESWSFGSLENSRRSSRRVQNHLTLCCALCAYAVGVYLHILLNIGGLLASLGVIGCIVWLTTTPPHDERKRFGILMGTALLEGATVGPLIERVIEFDPSIPLSAVVGTTLALGCFSKVTIVARRREFFYLGGMISSGLSILLWLRFASSISSGSDAKFNVEIVFKMLTGDTDFWGVFGVRLYLEIGREAIRKCASLILEHFTT